MPGERVKTTLYLHGGGDSTDEYSDLWDFEAKQQEVFHYCGYEESVEVEVDLDTGYWRYVSFNGLEIVGSPWYPGALAEPPHVNDESAGI